ncbi:TetR/AcrR family transcriptional regulator [Paenibacillus sp. WLX2291]|uniref:TetR/AcrR family transcriptional regulator n=1 Tax=Paenibacillus sp. WLX2291 TaxID=3296934 RepID=UPI003983EBCB
MVGMKNNRRTQYTREHIKKSFLTLLQDKDVSQITVSEICRLADINRGTFYLHYKDCYHLLECLQQEMYQQIHGIMTAQQEFCQSGGALTKLLQTFQEQRALYQLLLLRDNGRQLLTRIILEMYTWNASIHQPITDDDPNLSANDTNVQMGDLDYRFTYMVYGAMGVINQWLEAGAKQSVDEIADIISSFSHSTDKHGTK